MPKFRPIIVSDIKFLGQYSEGVWDSIKEDILRVIPYYTLQYCQDKIAYS